MLYFDTSALLPYYREEAASRKIQTLLSQQKQAVLISWLTQTEVASALARWVRMEEISEVQANQITLAFQEDIDDGRLQLCAITNRHYERAYQWLLMRKMTLRTLDALHLACAASAKATLVSLDNKMQEAGAFLGFHLFEWS